VNLKETESAVEELIKSFAQTGIHLESIPAHDLGMRFPHLTNLN